MPPPLTPALTAGGANAEAGLANPSVAGAARETPWAGKLVGKFTPEDGDPSLALPLETRSGRRKRETVRGLAARDF